MESKAFRRFVKSMEIGYEQWHDGIGYDLQALDELSGSEIERTERLLLPRAANDWRDLEALGRLGTPAAIQAIYKVRQSANSEMSLRAHEVGPAPSDAEWESAILAALAMAAIYSELIPALRCAIEHPAQSVKNLPWTKVHDAGSGVAYHCAATLGCIAGVLTSLYDDSRRELLLRLVGPDSPDRASAIKELEDLVKPTE